MMRQRGNHVVLYTSGKEQAVLSERSDEDRSTAREQEAMSALNQSDFF
jgi:hypothetical protein